MTPSPAVHRGFFLLLGLLLFNVRPAAAQGKLEVEGSSFSGGGLQGGASVVEPACPRLIKGKLMRAAAGESVPVCIGGRWQLVSAVGRPEAAVILWSATLERELLDLRTALEGVEQIFREECAPREYEEVALIRVPRGSMRIPVIQRSQRDIDAAWERSERSAAEILRKFLAAPGRRRVVIQPDGNFVSPQLVPGRYLLLLVTRARPAERPVGSGSGVVVWWGEALLEPMTQSLFEFDGANGISWREMFK